MPILGAYSFTIQEQSLFIIWLNMMHLRQWLVSQTVYTC